MLNYKSSNRKILNKRYLPLLSLLIIPAVIGLSLSESLSFSDTPLQIQENIGVADILGFEIKKDDGIQRAYLMGHLELIVKDPEGNIKSYSQSDNVIVNNGENCTLKLLFQSVTGAAGNDVCTGANTVGFRYIGLDEGAGPYGEDDADLDDPVDSAGLSTPLFTTATWTNSTGTGGTSDATVALSVTFTNTGASETVQGAGLFNATATSTRGMMGHALASGGAATVDTSDTLTATYTIIFAGA